MEPTGFKIFDDTFGGFPRPAAIALIGPLGSGKSTFMKQLTVNMLKNDFYVLYYAIEESENDVRDSLGSFGLNVDEVTRDGRLNFIDMFSMGVQKLAKGLESTSPEVIVEDTFKFSDLVKAGQDFTLRYIKKKQFVVMDSITQIFLMSEPRAVYQYCQVMKYATRFANAIGMAALHTKVLEESTENAFLNFADIIIQLSKSEGSLAGSTTKNGSLRVLRIAKLDAPSVRYYYELTKQGIVVSPVAGPI